MDKKPAYSEIGKKLEEIVSQRPPWEAGVATLIALVKEKLPYVSWVGLYRLVDTTLWIGPYQGKVACAQIPAGRGVCGAAVARRKPILVPNVEEFPGHIICDMASRSELVIPIERRGKILGVLDLDSHDLAAFDETDLREISSLLEKLEGLES